MVDFSSESKEKVGQTVDVGEIVVGIFPVLCTGAEEEYFGSAADGACHVTLGGRQTTARKNESVEDSTELPLYVVDGGLEFTNVNCIGKFLYHVYSSHFCTDLKEFALSGLYHEEFAPNFRVPFVGQLGEEKSQVGIQFVKNAKGFNSCVGLGNACSVCKVGFSRVAFFGINHDEISF